MPFAAQGVDDDGNLIWNGPRVKMGLYEVRADFMVLKQKYAKEDKCSRHFPVNMHFNLSKKRSHAPLRIHRKGSQSGGLHY